MNALVGAHDAAVQMIDTSIVRVHQHGAYITRNSRQSMGRSRGGLTFGHAKDVLVLISNTAKTDGSAIAALGCVGKLPGGARSQIGWDAFDAVDYLTGTRRELRNTPS